MLYEVITFVENADGETLFLSDEMGTGTEPRLGGAIAEAIIEKLSSAGRGGERTWTQSPHGCCSN